MAYLISISDVVVSEDKSSLIFTISLNTAATESVSVYYRLDDGFADDYYGEYVDQYAQLNFAVGEQTKEVTVTLGSTDSTAENTENFYLVLYNQSANATIANSVGMASIFDNDTIVNDINGNSTIDSSEKAQLKVSDVVIDEQAGKATFVISMDKATTSDFSVTYQTANGTAASGTDYEAASGTLNFQAGETAQTITVNLINDGAQESDEIFYLNLGSPAGSGAGQIKIVDGNGTGVIGHDDGSRLSTVIASVNDPVVNENDGYVDFVVSLNAPASAPVSLTYYTHDGFADDYYSDYAARSGNTITFATGVTTKIVRVAIGDDSTAERIENIYLELRAVSSNVVISDQGNATIFDNDRIVEDTDLSATLESTEKASLSVHDVTVDEKSGTATFVVELDKATTNDFSISYNLVDGTATAGSDYVANATGKLAFAAGQTVQTLIVDLTDDALQEAPELFYLDLAASATGNGASQVKVVDDIGCATIGRSDGSALSSVIATVSDTVVNEEDGFVDFVITLNGPAQAPVTLRYYTLDGFADDYYSDYAYRGGENLVFATGETTKTVRVAIGNETTAETLENLYLRIDAISSNVTINDYGMASIHDDDTVVDDTDMSGTFETAEKAALVVRDVIVDEKAGTATFAVELDKATTDSFSVAYSLSSGSATLDTDFTGKVAGVLSFEAGQTVQTITVNIIDEGIAETNETFNLTLGNITGAAAAQVRIEDANGTALIGANDTASATPVLSVLDTIVVEDQGYVDFIVQLSGASTLPVQTNYYVNDGTADDYYGDYSDRSGTLIFSPGTTTQTVRVAIGNDTYNTEANIESLTLSLQSPVNATLGTSLATCRLADDDGTDYNPMAKGLSNDSYTVNSIDDDVLETSYGGTDTITVTAFGNSTAYTLNNNVEKLILGGSMVTGNGNSLNNTLTGNALANTLNGGIGNDTLLGGAGNDTLKGEAGADRLGGGIGSDVYYVSTGDSALEDGTTSGGTDLVYSDITWSLGNYFEKLTLTGTAAINGTGNQLANTITGNTANNALNGADGNDKLIGNSGNDTLNGGLGNDSMTGGTGNDFYYSDVIGDSVIETSTGGTDRVVTSYSAALATHTLVLSGNDTSKKTFAHVENLTLANVAAATAAVGSDLANNLIGNSLANKLYGQAGNDTLNGSTGNDLLDGGTGNDTLYLDNINDNVNETSTGGTDTVVIDFNAALGVAKVGVTTDKTFLYNSTANDYVENITLHTGKSTAITAVGYSNANVLTGNEFANKLYGEGGNDTLNGGTGNDSMYGGDGNDTFYCNTTADLISETATGGTDTVYVTFSASLGGAVSSITTSKTYANVENIVLQGSGLLNAIGSDTANNVLTGNSANNTLYGLGGNDTLSGGTGDDTMYGGAGNDTYYLVDAGDIAFEDYNSGIDTLISSFSIDIDFSYNFENITLSGTTALNAYGNSSNNRLIGNSGANVLDGYGGNDTLTGAAGADLFKLDAYGTGNSDTITDFTTAQGDKIELNFWGLPSSLTSGNLRQGAGITTAAQADDFLIYNSTTGKVYYDQDGSGSSYSAQEIALLGNKPVSLSITDFSLV